MIKVKGYYVIRQEAEGVYAMQSGPFSYEAAMAELLFFRGYKKNIIYKIIYTDIEGEVLLA